MALGFIRKMFTFGKSDAVTVDADPSAAQPDDAIVPEGPAAVAQAAEADLEAEAGDANANAASEAPEEQGPEDLSADPALDPMPAPGPVSSQTHGHRESEVEERREAEAVVHAVTSHVLGPHETPEPLADPVIDAAPASTGEEIDAAQSAAASVASSPLDREDTAGASAFLSETMEPPAASDRRDDFAAGDGEGPADGALEFAMPDLADHQPTAVEPVTPQSAPGDGEPVPPADPGEPAGAAGRRWSSAAEASEGRPAAASGASPSLSASQAPRLSWFQRLRAGLARTSAQLTGQIASIFTKRRLDEDTLQELEDVLIQADLGVETALRITDTLASGRYGKDIAPEEVSAIMASEIEKVLAPVARPLELDLSVRPHVILVVGVNGTGKTTTIGKLAAKLTRGGLKVTLAAGDTFRAAAIEQLKIWGERTGSQVVSSKLGADAAGLAYEAFERAKAAESDVLIIDTAGRLQNKTELMNELEKIVRVLGKHDPDAPHTVLQTIDATTGQNALSQVEIFRNVAGVNGLVMTKLDGTARGGILVAIAAKHKLPVYFIGVGEQIDDLEPFEAGDFARAIAGR